MATLLQVIAIGNLAADAQLAFGPDGTARAKCCVMHNPRARKGQPEPPAVPVNVTIWRKMAETLAPMLTKGSRVFVQGDLTVRTYQANDGSTRISIDMDGDKVLLLSNRGEHPSQSTQQAGGGFDDFSGDIDL